MVGGLDDVVHIDAFFRHTDGVCLEDVAGLFVGESASLDVVGVISEVDLCAMINASLQLHLLLFAEDGK